MFVNQQVFSGSYSFAPSGGEIIIGAFQRVQIRPTEITISHLQTAVLELNLLQAKFGSQQPNLWDVDLQSLPLTQGQATYSLPAETVMITNAYVRTGTSTSTVDRMIFPISQTEYAAISNKLTQGPPTQFWFNRLISPTITFYLTPDGNGPYTVNYYRVRTLQDALATNGYNVEVPSRFMDAIIAGLAYRLARVYAPQLEDKRKMDAQEAWDVAATQDRENVNLYIAPSISGYYR